MRALSQADLAQQLTDRGLAFQQQTVLKVEKGSRPLRLEEAVQIADVLETDLGHLLERSPEEAKAAELMLDLARLARRSAELERERREVSARYRELSEEFNRVQDLRATSRNGGDDGER